MGIMDDILKMDRQTPKESPMKAILDALPIGASEVNPSINYLNTKGGEFRIPLGGAYIGPYHIHSDKGPMVGTFHKDEQHDILIPLNETAANIIRRHLGYDCYPNNDYENFQQPNNSNNGGGSY